MKYLLILLAAGALIGCAHGGKGGHHGHHGCKKSCKQAKWKKMDTNGDGKVSKEEFTKKGAEKWTAMDANKDGFVTMEEKMAYKKAKKANCKSCGS